MMDALYSQKILALVAKIDRIGQLDAPDARASAVSKLCGSKVCVDMNMHDGIVTDFAHEVEACALGQASSAIMAREIIGATPDELRTVARDMRRMLKENGDPPQNSDRGGNWSELSLLESVRDYKNRHASTLLTFDAVEDCLAQLGV
ncbi:iron-sulfur cluster assembly scaffold protein [Candidatus Micropelagos thuwalensis]|nr:iron-sulfur cluster assembly scaffold protein [Candidatus Micropelagos thuwalensis]